MHVYAAWLVISLAVAANNPAVTTDEQALASTDVVLKEYVRELFESKQRVHAVKLLHRKAELDRGLAKERAKHWATQWARLLANQFYTVAGSQGFQDGYSLWRSQYPNRGARMKEAIDRIEKALSLESDHFESLLRLGEAYLYLGQAGTAYERLTRARDMDPMGGGELSLFLGYAQCLQGKTEQIEAGLAELRRANHDLGVHELASAYFVHCLSIAGRPSEAIGFAQKTWKTNPQFYRLLFQMAEILLSDWKSKYDAQASAGMKKDLTRAIEALGSKADSDPELLQGLRRHLSELNQLVEKNRPEENP